MTLHELDSLLMRIRDDEATSDEVHRARALVQVDERLPEELRAVALVDDIREDAVALLAVLGHDDGFGALMSEALLSEAVSEPAVTTPPQDAQILDLADAMDDELARPFDWPLAKALRAEAGQLDVARTVLAKLDLEEGITAYLAQCIRSDAGDIDVAEQVVGAIDDRRRTTPLADAVATVAGRVDVVAAVFAKLDLPVHDLTLASVIADEAGQVSIAEATVERIRPTGEYHATSLGTAIRAAAGDVQDVWQSVAQQIGSSNAEIPIRDAIVAEAGEVDVVHDVMAVVKRGSLGVVTELPEPANRPRWGVAAFVAVAAAALMMIGVRATVGELPMEVAPTPVQFAAAGEVVVHELEYSENVQVFQVEGDEGAVILWVDEEAVL